MKLGQRAVLWVKAGVDRNGDPTVASPVEIDVRWEYAARTMIGPEGTPITTSAMVMVHDEIALNSLLRLGKLRDLPDEPDNLHEVVSHESIPDIKEQNPQRNVITQAWKRSLPEVV